MEGWIDIPTPTTREMHLLCLTSPSPGPISSPYGTFAPCLPVSPCPLEGFAFAYFPTAGAGMSFALAAPMATIFSIIA